MKAEEYEKYVNSLPAGARRFVARQMEMRKGERNKINREDLLALMRKEPGLQSMTDRRMRRAIEMLREAGIRICHVTVDIVISGRKRTTYGYFLAETEDEYRAFRMTYRNYAYSMLDSMHAMDFQRALDEKEKQCNKISDMVLQSRLF